MQETRVFSVSAEVRYARAPLVLGPVAQWLEPAAHNGLVVGSSPTGPTHCLASAEVVRPCFIKAFVPISAVRLPLCKRPEFAGNCR